MLAGLLITMGSLGERVGRRRLLLIGAVVFGAASLVAAGANSTETLIVGRALLGVGGAALLPSTMALTWTMFTDPGPRAMAIGIWSGMLTAGVALGPVLSGVLVEHFWWGSVFLVNLPATALLLLGPLLLPESRDPAPGRFDLPSGRCRWRPSCPSRRRPRLAQLTALALDATPVERAGCASTLVGTGQAFGGALGMAALGSVGTALYHHRVPASAPAPARETLGGALAVAERLPGPAARRCATAGSRGPVTETETATPTARGIRSASRS